VSGDNHTVTGVRIGQAADVTVLVLGAGGTVVREIDKPGRTAGQLSVPYYGYGGSGKRLPAGRALSGPGGGQQRKRERHGGGTADDQRDLGTVTGGSEGAES